MFELHPLTTEDTINLIGIICTVWTIAFSISTAKKSLQEAIYQQKNENSLKNIDTLPKYLNAFINSIISLIIYTYVTPDKDKHQEASQNFDNTLPEIQSVLIMYGSDEALKIFYELKMLLMNTAQGAVTKITDIFSLAVLLCAQIRYDLTGESVKLKYFVDLLLPKMNEGQEEIYTSAKQYIEQLQLSFRDFN